MKRFFLIGYMGAGKTTLGKQVAKKAGLSFIDLDVFIENRYHKTIRAIFEEKGESGFREIEREALHEVACFENVVIATGGGVPCFFDNAEFMNKNGVTVYLQTNPQVLFNRLRIAKQSRPILKEKTDEELLCFIEDNLQRREPFYQMATLLFDANELDTRDQLDLATEKLAELMQQTY
ncbi:MAG: shikimate kinase [Bacteroidales bacterium]